MMSEMKQPLASPISSALPGSLPLPFSMPPPFRYRTATLSSLSLLRLKSDMHRLSKLEDAELW